MSEPSYRVVMEVIVSRNESRELARRMLEETRADVAHADQKASVLLAALGIGFGTLVAGQFSGDWNPSSLSACGQSVWWAGIAAAVSSIVIAALAVWPRYSLTGLPQYGITYWGHVRAFDSAHALEAALEEQDVSDLGRTTHQLWSLSRIVLTKYRCIRSALLLAAASGLLLGLAVAAIQ
jgi:hypothetical protein